MNTAIKKTLSAFLAASLALAPALSLGESTAVDAVSGATAQAEERQAPRAQNNGKQQRAVPGNAAGDRKAGRGQKTPAAQSSSALYAAFAKTLLEKGIISQDIYNQILAYLNLSPDAAPAENGTALPETAGT